ncbi:hypothetical protein [Chondromyces apiculatus]|uniref:Lipoprotein n=1 Tax=Chondromyces apiculatus DSM 436 TaxID=1192034 RepID=A0A017TEH1_9BACT|nr:hypothetical protein [Chondromyces apiculatus]EYF07322.1 Hypothetical protein CAP_0801 [Chondromyces apiculatus DSM 436]
MIPSHARSALRLRPRFRVAAVILATAMLAGCVGSDAEGDGGGDGDGPPTDEVCGLSASVSGAYTATGDFNYCTGFYLQEDTLSVTFGAAGSEWDISFDIGPVTPGQTATGVPTIVQVSLTGDKFGTSWETEEGSCTVDLTRFDEAEDEFFGPGYDVAGEGRCSGPAKPTGTDQAEGDVTITPFELFFYTPE